jgi:hypothetical protein
MVQAALKIDFNKRLINMSQNFLVNIGRGSQGIKDRIQTR